MTTTLPEAPVLIPSHPRSFVVSGDQVLLRLIEEVVDESTFDGRSFAGCAIGQVAEYLECGWSWCGNEGLAMLREVSIRTGASYSAVNAIWEGAVALGQPRGLSYAETMALCRRVLGEGHAIPAEHGQHRSAEETA